MATIIEDLFGGSGNPIGRTPDTVDNGNTYTQLGDDATFNVQSGYCGITGIGTGVLAQQNRNPLVIDCDDPNIVITAVVWDKAGSGEGVRWPAGFRVKPTKAELLDLLGDATRRGHRLAGDARFFREDLGTEDWNEYQNLAADAALKGGG